MIMIYLGSWCSFKIMCQVDLFFNGFDLVSDEKGALGVFKDVAEGPPTIP